MKRESRIQGRRELRKKETDGELTFDDTSRSIESDKVETIYAQTRFGRCGSFQAH